MLSKRDDKPNDFVIVKAPKKKKKFPNLKRARGGKPKNIGKRKKEEADFYGTRDERVGRRKEIEEKERKQFAELKSRGFNPRAGVTSPEQAREGAERVLVRDIAEADKKREKARKEKARESKKRAKKIKGKKAESEKRFLEVRDARAEAAKQRAQEAKERVKQRESEVPVPVSGEERRDKSAQKQREINNQRVGDAFSYLKEDTNILLEEKGFGQLESPELVSRLSDPDTKAELVSIVEQVLMGPSMELLEALNIDEHDEKIYDEIEDDPIITPAMSEHAAMMRESLQLGDALPAYWDKPNLQNESFLFHIGYINPNKVKRPDKAIRALSKKEYDGSEGGLAIQQEAHGLHKRLNRLLKYAVDNKLYDLEGAEQEMRARARQRELNISDEAELKQRAQERLVSVQQPQSIDDDRRPLGDAYKQFFEVFNPEGKGVLSPIQKRYGKILDDLEKWADNQKKRQEDARRSTFRSEMREYQRNLKKYREELAEWEKNQGKVGVKQTPKPEPPREVSEVTRPSEFSQNLDIFQGLRYIIEQHARKAISPAIGAKQQLEFGRRIESGSDSLMTPFLRELAKRLGVAESLVRTKNNAPDIVSIAPIQHLVGGEKIEPNDPQYLNDISLSVASSVSNIDDGGGDIQQYLSSLHPALGRNSKIGQRVMDLTRGIVDADTFFGVESSADKVFQDAEREAPEGVGKEGVGGEADYMMALRDADGNLVYKTPDEQAQMTDSERKAYFDKLMRYWTRKTNALRRTGVLGGAHGSDQIIRHREKQDEDIMNRLGHNAMMSEIDNAREKVKAGQLSINQFYEIYGDLIKRGGDDFTEMLFRTGNMKMPELPEGHYLTTRPNGEKRSQKETEMAIDDLFNKLLGTKVLLKNARKKLGLDPTDTSEIASEEDLAVLFKPPSMRTAQDQVKLNKFTAAGITKDWWSSRLAQNHEMRHELEESGISPVDFIEMARKSLGDGKDVSADTMQAVADAFANQIGENPTLAFLIKKHLMQKHKRHIDDTLHHDKTIAQTEQIMNDSIPGGEQECVACVGSPHRHVNIGRNRGGKGGNISPYIYHHREIPNVNNIPFGSIKSVMEGDRRNLLSIFHDAKGFEDTEEGFERALNYLRNTRNPVYAVESALKKLSPSKAAMIQESLQLPMKMVQDEPFGITRDFAQDRFLHEFLKIAYPKDGQDEQKRLASTERTQKQDLLNAFSLHDALMNLPAELKKQIYRTKTNSQGEMRKRIKSIVNLSGAQEIGEAKRDLNAFMNTHNLTVKRRDGTEKTKRVTGFNELMEGYKAAEIPKYVEYAKDLDNKETELKRIAKVKEDPSKEYETLGGEKRPGYAVIGYANEEEFNNYIDKQVEKLTEDKNKLITQMNEIKQKAKKAGSLFGDKKSFNGAVNSYKKGLEKKLELELAEFDTRAEFIKDDETRKKYLNLKAKAKAAGNTLPLEKFAKTLPLSRFPIDNAAIATYVKLGGNIPRMFEEFSDATDEERMQMINKLHFQYYMEGDVNKRNRFAFNIGAQQRERSDGSRPVQFGYIGENYDIYDDIEREGFRGRSAETLGSAIDSAMSSYHISMPNSVEEALEILKENNIIPTDAQIEQLREAEKKRKNITNILNFDSDTVEATRKEHGKEKGYFTEREIQNKNQSYTDVNRKNYSNKMGTPSRCGTCGGACEVPIGVFISYAQAHNEELQGLSKDSNKMQNYIMRNARPPGYSNWEEYNLLENKNKKPSDHGYVACPDCEHHDATCGPNGGLVSDGVCGHCLGDGVVRNNDDYLKGQIAQHSIRNPKSIDLEHVAELMSRKEAREGKTQGFQNIQSIEEMLGSMGPLEPMSYYLNQAENGAFPNLHTEEELQRARERAEHEATSANVIASLRAEDADAGKAERNVHRKQTTVEQWQPEKDPIAALIPQESTHDKILHEHGRESLLAQVKHIFNETKKNGASNIVLKKMKDMYEKIENATTDNSKYKTQIKSRNSVASRLFSEIQNLADISAQGVDNRARQMFATDEEKQAYEDMSDEEKSKFLDTMYDKRVRLQSPHLHHYFGRMVTDHEHDLMRDWDNGHEVHITKTPDMVKQFFITKDSRLRPTKLQQAFNVIGGKRANKVKQIGKNAESFIEDAQRLEDGGQSPLQKITNVYLLHNDEYIKMLQKYGMFSDNDYEAIKLPNANVLHPDLREKHYDNAIDFLRNYNKADNKFKGDAIHTTLEKQLAAKSRQEWVNMAKMQAMEAFFRQNAQEGSGLFLGLESADGGPMGLEEYLKAREEDKFTKKQKMNIEDYFKSHIVDKNGNTIDLDEGERKAYYIRNRFPTREDDTDYALEKYDLDDYIEKRRENLSYQSSPVENATQKLQKRIDATMGLHHLIEDRANGNLTQQDAEAIVRQANDIYDAYHYPNLFMEEKIHSMLEDFGLDKDADGVNDLNQLLRDPNNQEARDELAQLQLLIKTLHPNLKLANIAQMKHEAKMRALQPAEPQPQPQQAEPQQAEPQPRFARQTTFAPTDTSRFSIMSPEQTRENARQAALRAMQLEQPEQPPMGPPTRQQMIEVQGQQAQQYQQQMEEFRQRQQEEGYSQEQQKLADFPQE